MLIRVHFRETQLHFLCSYHVCFVPSLLLSQPDYFWLIDRNGHLLNAFPINFSTPQKQCFEEWPPSDYTDLHRWAI